MNQKKLITVGALVFVGLILLLMVTNSTLLTIEAGERGVIFRPFSGGLDKETIYQPGFHIVAPWNTMYVYDVREKQLEESMEVLSSNGLTIRTEVTVRMNPQHDKIGNLHETFGKDYIERLVRPEIRSTVRKVVGRFQPEELYSTKREEVQEQINEDLENSLGGNYIALRASLIRDIKLPEKIQSAIERKLQQEQESEEYQYRLQKERQEAERKIIEAEAKAEANRILNASLSENILRDKGIEATMELANSPNTKVIVVGSAGSEGLPLILGGN